MPTVSIEQYPSSRIMPVYNPIVWTVDSTNKSECLFRYVCDVYVNGTFVKRLKRLPSGANGYGVFEVNRVLEDYLSYDLNDNLYGSSLFATNAGSCIDYVLKFGEEFDPSAQCDTGSSVTADIVLSSSIGTFSAFNGALQRKEWLDWDSDDYKSNDVNSKFLTNFPDEGLITIGSQAVMNIFNDDIRKLKVITYDSSGTPIGTYTYSNSYTSVTNSTNRLLTVGVGPENLNNSTLFSGSQPVITSDVAYYTVQLLKTADAVASELRTFTLDYRYSKWEKHRLWFLGRLGSMESYTFTLKDGRKVETSRTEYKHLNGSFTDGSPYGSWSYNLKDRGRTTLSVNAQESRTWISNWLTEAEALWMEELFTSPEVYTIIDNPVVCFPYFTLFTNDPMDGQRARIPVVSDVPVAGNILLMCNAYEQMNGVFAVLESDGESIVIDSPFGFGYDDATYNDGDGAFMALGADGELRPLIFKTNGYEEKKKNNVKNINYIIEVDEAEAINTQRN